MQGLHAFRPFHAGAYTDPGPPALDETSKALQTIAKVMAAKEDPAAQDRGKLSSIGRTEERMLYLARGCDTLTVHLGEATVGKEPYHALKSVATQNRPLLREISFPVASPLGPLPSVSGAKVIRLTIASLWPILPRPRRRSLTCLARLGITSWKNGRGTLLLCPIGTEMLYAKLGPWHVSWGQSTMAVGRRLRHNSLSLGKNMPMRGRCTRS